jgi:hypothetical protein
MQVRYSKIYQYVKPVTSKLNLLSSQTRCRGSLIIHFVARTFSKQSKTIFIFMFRRWVGGRSDSNRTEAEIRKKLYVLNFTKFIFEFYVHMTTTHRNKLLFNKTNRRTRFQIYSGTKLYMFRVVTLPIIRS